MNSSRPLNSCALVGTSESSTWARRLAFFVFSFREIKDFTNGREREREIDGVMQIRLKCTLPLNISVFFLQLYPLVLTLVLTSFCHFTCSSGFNLKIYVLSSLRVIFVFSSYFICLPVATHRIIFSIRWQFYFKLHSPHFSEDWRLVTSEHSSYSVLFLERLSLRLFCLIDIVSVNSNFIWVHHLFR